MAGVDDGAVIMYQPQRTQGQRCWQTHWHLSSAPKKQTRDPDQMPASSLSLRSLSVVASDAVVAAAVAEGRERRRGVQWLMGSKGSNCAKGVSSGRWVAAGEGVEFGQGSGGASMMVFVIIGLQRLWRRGGRGAKGDDGQRGCNGSTVQRASTPGKGRQWGRASDPAEAGGGGNIYGVSGGRWLLHLSLY
jgi:hypothetical protein